MEDALLTFSEQGFLQKEHYLIYSENQMVLFLSLIRKRFVLPKIKQTIC